MRTIYLVCGDNREKYAEDHRWWNIQAFNSKEDAERFIVEKQEEYCRDMKRRDEIEDRWDRGDIADGEKAEYGYIATKWNKIVYTLDPEREWYIKEIQFQE